MTLVRIVIINYSDPPKHDLLDGSNGVRALDGMVTMLGLSFVVRFMVIRLQSD